MPLYYVPEELITRQPLAIVQPFCDEPSMVGHSLKPCPNVKDSDEVSCRSLENRSPDEYAPSVSNRDSRGRLNVIFVNGMNTSELDAEIACQHVRTTLGVSRDDIKLLYNASEGSACNGLANVVGSSISRRLGEVLESECTSALRTEIDRVITTLTDRLLVVGHSQGSVIFQNASDAVYDRLSKTNSGQRLWESSSLRIEALFYAPVIRHAAPGMQVVGFTNESDFPGRFGSCISNLMATSKNCFCWRKYEPVELVVLPCSKSLVADAMCAPLAGHLCSPLILKDPLFNVAYYGTDSNGGYSPKLLAARLAYSIRHGLRSDTTHHKIIELSARTVGPEFAKAFLKRITIVDRVGWIGQFRIDSDVVDCLIRSQKS